MKCDWNALLHILPVKLRQGVDKLSSEGVQEVRLRLGALPSVQLSGKRILLSDAVTIEDLDYVVNSASRYSPWSVNSAADGYIAAQGGHRVGLCGEAVVQNGRITGFRSIHSVNIRVARDFPGIASRLATYEGNFFILGPPGSGKTTLLRDLIRYKSKNNNVAVVDERGELFPPGMNKGNCTDVITGCSKKQALMMLLRTMTPDVIAVDEITETTDAEALMHAFYCGVDIIATAHALDGNDFRNRSVYRPIADHGLVDNLVILCRDKSYRTERLTI